MDINNFMPGGQSSTNIDYGGNDWVDKVGKITAGGGFGLSGLMSLFAKKPQYIIKADSGDLEFQSMLEMSCTEDSSLPSEPIEQSSFATYNRVIEPLDIKCRLGVQGYPSVLQSMIDRLSELRKGTEKLTFITPSASYESLMLQGFDYRVDNHTGFNVLLVDLTFKEIREVPTFLTTSSVTEPDPPPVDADSAADGSCASEVDSGEVQSYNPSSYEESASEKDGNESILYGQWGEL
jgi:hypothetical protein